MSILQAVGLTLLPNLGGFAGSLMTRNKIKNWYEKLDKPSWRPPNWLFGPAWTTLYSAMGYSSYLILRDGVGEKKQLALTLYASQLALNWAWTPIYFVYQKQGLALAEMLLMLANIGACIYKFYTINKTASYLMVPYFAWVSFASLITYNIWQRNKDKKIFRKAN